LAETERWWLERLGPHRTARVTVHSTAIVQSIYGVIQQYAGIERPEWVDGRLPSTTPP
jgi:hypothetical protein